MKGNDNGKVMYAYCIHKLKNSEKQKYVKALWKENAQEKIVVMHILKKN